MLSDTLGSNHPVAPTVSVEVGLPTRVWVPAFQVGTSPMLVEHEPGLGEVSQKLKPLWKPSSAADTSAPFASFAVTRTWSASMSANATIHPVGGVGRSKVYVVTDGVVAESARGRRLRYGWSWLEPYFAPTGVFAPSHDVAPEITPTDPERESDATTARGKPCAGSCIVVA